MIIQCEQCHTKFKLDDSKVTEKGVKVRCAKCKHIFTVHKKEQEEEQTAEFANMLDNKVEHTSAPSAPSQGIPDFETSNFKEDTPTAKSEFDASTFDFSEEQPDSQSQSQSPPSSDDDFSLSSLGDDNAFSGDSSNTASVDFDTFDFGDTTVDTDKTLLSPPLSNSIATDETVVQKASDFSNSDFGGLDFSGDSMFGEVVAQTPEEPAQDISFDLQMDDFASSLGVDNEKNDVQNEKTIVIQDTAADSPFSLDEIDFGDELTSVAVQQVNPDELKPGQEILFAPLAEATIPPPLAISPTVEAEEKVSVPDNDELPPLSIASRRKQGPTSAIVAGLGILIVLIASYFGYSALKSESNKNVSQDTGRIAIRGVQASFVKNKGVGELLIIKGDAVNEFNKTRAAIQVKATIYGTKGEVLSSKNAFCGNPLTEEQLSNLSLEEIEGAMANQFGDSLANMEVLPGKAVPFVVVIAKPPLEAKDFAVETAGSTAAASKQ